MGVVDFILNLAGLLLWLNWRSNRFDPLVRRAPATLMGTLRPAAPRRLSRWHLLAFLAALLVSRALVYWWIGAETNWAAKINLCVVVLWFSSNAHWIGFCHMVVFSFLSFAVFMGIFYVWLLLLSLLAGPLPLHGLVTIPLGRVDGWPRWAKVLLPFFATAVSWMLAGWLLDRLQILPPAPQSVRLEQSAVIGLTTYLLWQFPLVIILLLYLVNSYIYFGKHPFWKYIGATAQAVLQPLRRVPLKVGRVDFAPLVGMVLIFLAAYFAQNGIKSPERRAENGQHLPPAINIPGLMDIYSRLPL